MKRSIGLAAQLIGAHMAMGLAAGLPAPGTSNARRLAPLLPKPQIDARAPEVRAEQKAIGESRKQYRERVRREAQEKKRTDKAMRMLLPATVETLPAGAPTRLDLSLIHEPRRRAKLSAIGIPNGGKP